MWSDTTSATSTRKCAFPVAGPSAFKPKSPHQALAFGERRVEVGRGGEQVAAVGSAGDAHAVVADLGRQRPRFGLVSGGGRVFVRSQTQIPTARMSARALLRGTTPGRRR